MRVQGLVESWRNFVEMLLKVVIAMDVDGQYPRQFWIVLMPIPSEQKLGSFEYSGELATPEKADAAADRMAYMADLLLELQRLAVRPMGMPRWPDCCRSRTRKRCSAFADSRVFWKTRRPQTIPKRCRTLNAAALRSGR
jgi:hypothetical protein